MTATEEVVRLLCDEYLTTRQAAQRRNTTMRAVRKLAQKAVREGMMFRLPGGAWRRGGFLPEEVGSAGGQGAAPLSEKRHSSGNPLGPYRLHAERWLLPISQATVSYQRLFEREPKPLLRGSRLILGRSVLQVYSRTDFYGETQEQAEERSAAHWLAYFAQIGAELGVTFAGCQRVLAHYAYMGSEISQRAEYRHEKLAVRGQDGKVWLLVDNSFNLHEHEEVHPRSAAADCGKVDKQLNDWRQHDPPTASELAGALKAQGEISLSNGASVQLLAASITGWLRYAMVRDGVPLEVAGDPEKMQEYIKAQERKRTGEDAQEDADYFG